MLAQTKSWKTAGVLALIALVASPGLHAQAKPRIAVFSGPTATIQNSPPLVTSDTIRQARGLPPRRGPGGSGGRFDHLVPQRLAAPVEVLIEQFSGHPLEKDAAHLYGPPDGYVDSQGDFHTTRQSAQDKPVYKVTLRPEDGPYLLPYAALQVDGRPWDDACTQPGAPLERCRQTFYPDASRIFEEIDRTISGRDFFGTANILSSKADFDFYRAAPSGGYTKGLTAPEGVAEDIAPEKPGEDFFLYGRFGLIEPRAADLARATNVVQRALSTGKYAGAIWLEGSPTVQDTAYWLGLLIDTTVPIAANSAHRTHGAIGDDGSRNMVDSVDYIISRRWADEQGRDQIGAVLVQDEQIITARQAEKQDGRPGGYRAAGAHGGVVGTIGDPGPVTLWFRPATLHTWKSKLTLAHIPAQVEGLIRKENRTRGVPVRIKDERGELLPGAIPKVTAVRYDRWALDSSPGDPQDEVEVLARIEENLRRHPLAGFVAEGITPYGAFQASLARALELAALSGMPVVRVSRGHEAGMVPSSPFDLMIEGNNLTASKARLLLMAALMKFGSLPPAADPRHPTAAERKAIQDKVNLYQEIFDTH